MSDTATGDKMGRGRDRDLTDQACTTCIQGMDKDILTPQYPTTTSSTTNNSQAPTMSSLVDWLTCGVGVILYFFLTLTIDCS